MPSPVAPPLAQPATWHAIRISPTDDEAQHEQCFKQAEGLAKKGTPVLIDLQGSTVKMPHPIGALCALLRTPGSVVKLVNGSIFTSWAYLDIHGQCWMEDVGLSCMHCALPPTAPVPQPSPMPMLRITAGSLELLRCTLSQRQSPHVINYPVGTVVAKDGATVRARSCVFNSFGFWVALSEAQAYAEDCLFRRSEAPCYKLPDFGLGVGARRRQ